MATIRKRGDSYSIRVSMGYDSNGGHIEKSMTWKPEPGMSEKQIQKELNRQVVLFEERCKSGLFLDGNIKFCEFAEQWFEEYAKKQLKAKTYNRYLEFLERTNKAIGHLKLSKIQPVHLMAFYNNLSEPGIRSDIKYKSDILGDYIKNNNITKVYLKSVSGLSEMTIRNACKGENITLNSAEKISEALGFKLKNLFKIADDSKTTLSGKTILEYHRFISVVLQTAVQWQVILLNPCDRVKPPKVVRKESKYIDNISEIYRLLECLESEPLKYKAMITLLLNSGMRRGELCGLKWSDVLFDKKIICINREVIYLPGKGLIEDTPKTKTSQRKLKIAEICISHLKEYKKEQTIDRIKVGDQWQDNDYVFTQWNGQAIHPDTLTSWFKCFVKKNNLPDISLHSLRHTYASLLILNNERIPNVSKRLGHSNPTTTTKIYSHVIQLADEMQNDVLEDILCIGKNK